DPRGGGERVQERAQFVEEAIELGHGAALARRSEHLQQCVDERVHLCHLKLEDLHPLQCRSGVPAFDPAAQQLEVDDGRVDRVLDLVGQCIREPAEQVETVRLDLEQRYRSRCQFHLVRAKYGYGPWPTTLPARSLRCRIRSLRRWLAPRPA